MFKRIASLFGTKPASPAEDRKAGMPLPYQNDGINTIYNLLFCDQAALFEPRAGQLPTDWQTLLFSNAANAAQVLALANDEKRESRVRALAYHWLRAREHEVPQKILLGVVVEVPLEGGLDALAAYADGQVRYINQSEKVSVFDGGPPAVVEKATALVETGKAIVNRIGPWNKPRLAAPKAGNIRMTFIVSDGLYFGDGPYLHMREDPMAAPFVAKAEELLQLVVDTAISTQRN